MTMTRLPLQPTRRERVWRYLNDPRVSYVDLFVVSLFASLIAAAIR